MRGRLRKVVKEALKKLGIVKPPRILIAHTKNLRNGDYYTNIAHKIPNSNPNELAEKIVQEVKRSEVNGVMSISPAAGFINFYLSPSELASSIRKANKEGGGDKKNKWGTSTKLRNKKIMVEFTDPNPFKEFHIGHLMSNAIGESISRLLQSSGADVKRANYQGDVGLHVAKAIYAYKTHPPTVDNEIVKWGLAYKIGNDLYENNEEAKKEIDKINKQVYEHDKEISDIYNAGRKVSLDYFETIYKKLGMEEREHFGEKRHFDYYFFESASWEIGKALVQQYTPAVFEESEGALVFHGEKFDASLHTRVFITSKGLPAYEAKELGLLKSKIDKWGWNFDKSITITGNEQEEYLRVVLAAAKQIEELRDAANKTKHIVHGMMRFADGKMSSRTGNVVTALGLLQELIEVAKERAKESRSENPDKLALHVALAAFKYQILKQASGKDIIFDRERALSLEGDSGPYLQYAHARANAIVEKAKEQNVAAKVDSEAATDELTRMLHRFPEIVEYATSLYEPHLLTSYLLEVASRFNSWYAQVQILGTPEVAHKVAVVDAVRRTLKNGLWVLGIPAPERM